MSKRWALIKDGYVENKIIADDSFIPSIEPGFDAVIDLTGMNPEPEIDATYDINTHTFSDPPTSITDLYIDPTTSYLTTGDNQIFPPFTLPSSDTTLFFTVSITANQHWVDIGCRRYRAIWFRYALYNIYNGLANQVGPLWVSGDVIMHEPFIFYKTDAKRVLDALETVKFITPY